MGTKILIYILNFVQYASLMMWLGSLMVILFVTKPKMTIGNFKDEFTVDVFSNGLRKFLRDSLNKLELLILLAISLIWISILLYIATISSNPFTNRYFLIYLALIMVLTLVSLINIFGFSNVIKKTERNIIIFRQEDIRNQLIKKLSNYQYGYYALSFLSLIIGLIILFIKQL